MSAESESSTVTINDVERLYPNMSESEKLVMLLLSSDKPKKIGDLTKETSISLRSIRYSLKKLLNKDLIISFPDFNDLRSQYYQRRA
jgi:DNA-binding MarR family transcriptional regulator